jgi:hypothetical protein
MSKRFLVFALLVGGHAWAQHHQPGGTGAHPHPAASPYAGEKSREIKALSADEQRAWLEGRGAGLAQAAELNSHPGPMHVLEHAGALGLSASQEKESRALMARHKAEVRRLGADLVEAERELDDLFKTRRATAPAVRALTQKVGTLQARIRASHLVTHLEQAAILRSEQVETYDRLRGYAR